LLRILYDLVRIERYVLVASISSGFIEWTTSKPLSPKGRLRVAQEHYRNRTPLVQEFLTSAAANVEQGSRRVGAFELHRTIENAYSMVLLVLLVLTNHDPATHNIKLLRSPAEDRDRRLADARPRGERRFAARFNAEEGRREGQPRRTMRPPRNFRFGLKR
jgi:hypothetical protein